MNKAYCNNAMTSMCMDMAMMMAMPMMRDAHFAHLLPALHIQDCRRNERM